MTTPATDTSDLEVRLARALAPRYQLLRRLGQGGMGTVFLAREPSLKRLVAVKVLSPELVLDLEAHVRFEREAQAVASLAHPNVIGIYGVGQLDDGMPYFVMQYVEGQSLAERVDRDGALPIAEARRIVAEVASALAAAHAKGIVHRDIKPANVLQDDASGRVLVTDFGLVAVERTSGDMPALNVTQTGMRVGTPQYMSPEQLLAEPPTDRTDVYALGLLAYELVTGVSPFSGKSPSELIAAHLRDVPPRLAVKRSETDAELDALVAAALEKDPAKRPSAQDIAQRLAPGGVAVLEWPPPGLEEWLGVARPQGRWLFWTAGVMTIALALLFGLGIRLVDVGNVGFGSVLIVAVVLGGVASVVRLRLLFETLRGMAKSVRGGYGWATVLEVATDPRGDTGALIAGARRFASLEAPVRATLRRGRVLAGTLGAVAPALAPVMAALWMVLGAAAGWSPRFVMLLAVAPLFVAELVRVAVWMIERAGAGASSATSAAAPRELGDVAAQWYGSLERAGGGTAPTRRNGYRIVPWFGAVALVAAPATLAFVSPMMLIPARAAVFAEVSFGDAATTLAATRQVAAYASVALPLDSGITPEVAGRLLHDVLGAAPSAAAPSRAQERPQTRAPQSLPPLARPDVDSLPVALLGDLGWLDADTLWARIGLGRTAEEFRHLEQLARHPVWSLFDSLARAPVADALSGMYGTPLPTELTAGQIRGPSTIAIRELVRANASRAAYYAYVGDTDSARFVLRAGIGFARVTTTLADYLPMLTGNTMMLVTRALLRDFSAVRPNPDGDRLAAIQDSLVRPRSMVESMQLNAARRGIGETARARAIRDLRNPSLPVAFKFGQLQSLAMSQCTTLGEAIFGPAEDLRAAFRYAQDSVARTDAERQFVRLILDLPATYADEPWREPGAPIQTIGKWLELSARAIGARRLQGCAHVLAARAAD